MGSESLVRLEKTYERKLFRSTIMHRATKAAKKKANAYSPECSKELYILLMVVDIVTIDDVGASTMMVCLVHGLVQKFFE